MAISHPKLSPAARRDESPERLAHVTSDPGSSPPVGHTPRAAQPRGRVHVPHSMSFTAAAPKVLFPGGWRGEKARNRCGRVGNTSGYIERWREKSLIICTQRVFLCRRYFLPPCRLETSSPSGSWRFRPRGRPVADSALRHHRHACCYCISIRKYVEK